MDPVNEQIALLYGGVHRYGLDQFKDFAMALLRAIVPFDSAIWASGEARTRLVHSAHLINQRLDDIMALTLRHGDEETITAAAFAQPGLAVCLQDTMPMSAYRQLALYRETACRLGIEQAMGLAITDPVNNLSELVVLYRNDPQRPFSSADRAAIAVLVPHLLEAWRNCQFYALRQPEQIRTDSEGACLHGRAICDWFGTITQAEPGFGTVVEAAFPGWHGTKLPDRLVAFIRSDHESHAHGAFRFEIVRGRQHHIVSVMGTVRGSLLSAAELDVARRVAAGHSHVRIAAARGVSNATVRNQTARVYEKLGIHSRSELTQVLLSLQIGLAI